MMRRDRSWAWPEEVLGVYDGNTHLGAPILIEFPILISGLSELLEIHCNEDDIFKDSIICSRWCKSKV